MKLSVVMAVRNGEPHLRDAIESVLAQSIADFEFLIVDDASTDQTPGILSEYQRRDSRIRVFHNDTNLGPYPSTNLALTHARGRCIARHDADDISTPERFAIQLDALDSAPETSLVTGMVEVFGPNRGRLKTIGPPAWQPRLEWELLFGNVVGAGAHVMFPRVLRGTPVVFPATYRYAEDYGLWCSLSRLGRVVTPEQVVYRYRQHDLSITGRTKAEQSACVSKIRQAYQSQYLRSDVSEEASAELSRFWLADGNRSLVGNLRGVNLLLTELRANFLAYIEQRYGRSDRTTLESQLDEALAERLGYWLYRSVQFRDRTACGELLSIAGDRQEVVNVSGKAVRRAAGAVLRKIRRPALT